MAGPRRGSGILDSRSAMAAVANLEYIEQQLGVAAAWLDDLDQVRAAAMIMSAQRDLLAACHLIRPPTPQELVTVIEQRAEQPQNGWHGTAGPMQPPGHHPA